MNTKYHFGGVEQGDDAHIFPVQRDWDGFRLPGYFIPTLDEIKVFYGSVQAACAAWDARYGKS